jgi:hypothetical protein
MTSPTDAHQKRAGRILGLLSPCPPPAYEGNWSYWRAFVLQPAIAQALADERRETAEACAEIADEMEADVTMNPDGDIYCDNHGRRINAAIRARFGLDTTPEEPSDG